jgi:putative endonuclease
MIIVYVLKSKLDGVHYVGMAKDAIVRLKEHNSGRNHFTKGHMPWEIIYTEEHPDWASARVREKYLKTAAGKTWLYKHLPFTEGREGSLPA